jgi:hypothetical protein
MRKAPLALHHGITRLDPGLLDEMITHFDWRTANTPIGTLNRSVNFSRNGTANPRDRAFTAQAYQFLLFSIAPEVGIRPCLEALGRVATRHIETDLH